MNTANKLTLLRVVMIPLFLLVLYLGADLLFGKILTDRRFWGQMCELRLGHFCDCQPHRYPGRLYRSPL